MSQNKSVFKYDLPFPWDGLEFNLSLPRGSEILDAQLQYDRARLWALIDRDEAETETRLFRWAGTGQVIGYSPEVYNVNHIATVQFNGGDLVYHLFEVIAKHRRP